MPFAPRSWTSTLLFFLWMPLGCEPDDEGDDSGRSEGSEGSDGSEDTGGSGGEDAGDAGGEDTGDVPIDADGDGFSEDEDCDDSNPDVYPGAEELCNEEDDDCDGSFEDEYKTWYTDDDGDGFGDGESSVQSCEAPDGHVEDSSDCNDGDSGINPDSEEVCDDSTDNDCDGQIDIQDPSTDGFSSYLVTIDTHIDCWEEFTETCDLEYEAVFVPDESILFEIEWDCDVSYQNVSPENMFFIGSMDSNAVLTIQGTNGDDIDCAIWGGVCDGEDEWSYSDHGEPGWCYPVFSGQSMKDEEIGTETDCYMRWTADIVGLATDGEGRSADYSYALDWSAAEITEPSGLGPSFKPYAELPSLLGMIDLSSTEMDLILAHGTKADPEIQDTDIATHTWNSTTTDGSIFIADVGDVTLTFDGADMEVEDMFIMGDLSSDRSTISDAKFTYNAHVSFAMDILGVSSVEEACDMLESLDDGCQACNSGDVECLTVTLKGIEGTQLSSTTIVEVE